jgi:hypothetical protein
VTAPKLARPARSGEPGFADGGRVYEHPVTKMVVPSITATKDMVDKPALKHAAAWGCARFVSENLSMLDDLDDDKQRRRLIHDAPFNEWSAKARIGDLVHEAIDVYIKTGGDIQAATLMNADWPITAKHMWESFLRFVNEYNPEWIDAEFTVWSNTWGFAGTMDWAAKIRGWFVLGDTKTGESVWPETGLQLAAGANADFILRADGTEVPLPRFDRCAVLHVRPRSASLVPMEKIPECWEAFKAARVLKQWHDFHAPSVVQQIGKLTKEVA